MPADRHPSPSFDLPRRLAAIGISLVLLAGGGEADEGALRVEAADGVVEVAARNVPLGELLRELARQCHLDLHLDAPLPEPIDLEFRALSVQHAVERIFQGGAHAYGYSRPSPGGDRRATLWVFTGRSGDDARSAGEADRVTHQADPRLAPLLAALAEPDAERRSDTVFRLAQLGGEMAAAALADRALFDEEPAVREEALTGLGEIGDANHLATLEGALLDPEMRVREAAVWALAEIGGDEAAWALATALSDEDPSLRAEAAYALGEIGGEGAVHLLERALADERQSVQEAAAEMLAELTAPR